MLHHEARAADGSEIALAFEQPNSGVLRGPVAQALGRAIVRGVVVDDEFEVPMALAENAPDCRVQMWQRVVNRHDDTDELTSRVGAHLHLSAARKSACAPATAECTRGMARSTLTPAG